MHTAPHLALVLRAACVAAHPGGALVVDLSGIRFCSATGLTLLLTSRQYCHDHQAALSVVASHRSVVRLLEITGLATLFDIVSTMAEAIRPPGIWSAATQRHTTRHTRVPAVGGNEHSASETAIGDR